MKSHEIEIVKAMLEGLKNNVPDWNKDDQAMEEYDRR